MRRQSPGHSADGNRSRSARSVYRDVLARCGWLMPNHGNLPYALVPAAALPKVIAANMLERYRHRRVIFCASSGRAGSGYLANLLGTADNVHAFHEPRPRMTGRFLHLTEKAPMSASYDRRLIKVVGICNHLRQLPDDAVYAETNHMFVKAFYDVTLDSFSNATVVLLRRDMARTLKSLIDLGYFTASSWHWRLWMQSQDSVNAAIRPAAKFVDLDTMDKAIAYLLDIEARGARLRREYPDVHFVESRTEDIATVAGAEALLDKLGLAVEAEKIAAIADRRNARPDMKKRTSEQVSLDYCRQRITSYCRTLSPGDLETVAPLVRDIAAFN